jgi:hypothetical protein
MKLRKALNGDITGKKRWVMAAFKPVKNAITFGSKQIPYFSNEMEYGEHFPKYNFEDLSWRESKMIDYEEC